MGLAILLSAKSCLPNPGTYIPRRYLVHLRRPQTQGNPRKNTYAPKLLPEKHLLVFLNSHCGETGRLVIREVLVERVLADLCARLVDGRM